MIVALLMNTIIFMPSGRGSQVVKGKLQFAGTGGQDTLKLWEMSKLYLKSPDLSQTENNTLRNLNWSFKWHLQVFGAGWLMFDTKLQLKVSVIDFQRCLREGEGRFCFSFSFLF